MRFRGTAAAVLLAATMAAAAAEDDSAAPEETKVWSNGTEMSIVFTEGNSSTQTIGLKNNLRAKWEKRRFSFKVDLVKSDTADDRFAVVDCAGQDAVTCSGNLPPDPADAPWMLVEPSLAEDVGKYFIEGIYSQTIRKSFFWNAGANWYRDIDAGIVSRYVVFAGVGNVRWDREDLHFSWTYGLSFTDREEEDEDPEKDVQFLGVRLGWDFHKKWGGNTTYENLWDFNISVKDTNDYQTNMTNSIAVSINKWLALKASLRWLYSSEPALEDIDLFLDPDENLKVGEVQIRKKKLDTIFNTSLIVSF